jgi:hypothetical protein
MRVSLPRSLPQLLQPSLLYVSGNAFFARIEADQSAPADDFGVDWTPHSVTMWVKTRVRIAFRYGFGTSKTFWKLGGLFSVLRLPRTRSTG